MKSLVAAIMTALCWAHALMAEPTSAGADESLDEASGPLVAVAASLHGGANPAQNLHRRAVVPQFVGKRAMQQDIDFDSSYIDNGNLLEYDEPVKRSPIESLLRHYQGYPIQLLQEALREAQSIHRVSSREFNGPKSKTVDDYLDEIDYPVEPDIRRTSPMFVGKRRVPMFVGRRRAPMFVGRRRAPMFIGKRDEEEEIQFPVDLRKAPMFIGRRRAPMFIGKRPNPMFVGKRDTSLIKQMEGTGPKSSHERQKRSVLQPPMFAEDKRAWGRYVPWKEIQSLIEMPAETGSDVPSKRFIVPEFVGKRYSHQLSSIENALNVLEKAHLEAPGLLAAATKRFQAPLFVGKRSENVIEHDDYYGYPELDMLLNRKRRNSDQDAKHHNTQDAQTEM